MTAFLIIIAIALVGITIWQISKIFKLSKSGEKDPNPGVANDKDNKRHGFLFLLFLIAFFIFMIFNFWEYGELYPPNAAAHGVDFDRLMFISIVVIMIVQVITQFLLFYYSYKYSGNKDKKALFFADNDKLEFIWTIIPVITLSALIIYGLFTWTEIMNVDKDKDTLVIELYAYQFGWKARYAGKDHTLGKANVRFIHGINALGLDKKDPYSQDDKITSVLHLPEGREVLFKMRSQDVIHSAYMPFFRAQMNVVPGMITQFGFTPTVTTQEMRKKEDMKEKVASVNRVREKKGKGEYKFNYFILCNKVCGVSHFRMKMKVIVEEKEEFQKWLAEQPTFGSMMEKQNN